MRNPRNTLTLSVGGGKAQVTRSAFLKMVTDSDLDARAGLMLAAARVFARRKFTPRTEVQVQSSGHYLAVTPSGQTVLDRFKVAAPDSASIAVANAWLDAEAARVAIEAAALSENPEAEEAPKMITVRVPDSFSVDIAETNVNIRYDELVAHWALADEDRGEQRDVPMPTLIRQRVTALTLASYFQRHHALDSSAMLDGEVDDEGVAQYRISRSTAAGEKFEGEVFTVPSISESTVDLAAAWLGKAQDALREVAATRPGSSSREIAMTRLRSSGHAA